MFQVSHYAFSPDELPETVIVRDSAASASVKDEPGETPVTKSDPDIPPPPPNLIVKEDVDDDKNHTDDPNDSSDEPCTKMTMRLRRNLNNPQFVSLRETYELKSWINWIDGSIGLKILHVNTSIHPIELNKIGRGGVDLTWFDQQDKWTM